MSNPAPRRRLRVAALAVAVAVFAALGAMAPAAADPDPSSGSRQTQRPTPPAATDHSKPQRAEHPHNPGQPTKIGDCKPLTDAQKAQRLAAGETRTACVTRSNGNRNRPTLSVVSGGQIGRSATKVLDPFGYTSNIPQWCRDEPFTPDEWFYRRKDSCSYGWFQLTVRNTQSGQTVFDGIFTWGAYTFTDANVLNIYNGIQARLDSYTGNLAGLSMFSEMECGTEADASCNELEEHDFGAFQVIYQYEHDSWGVWQDVLPTETSTYEPMNWIWDQIQIILVYPGADIETLYFANMFFECDNLMPQPSSPGCVMRWYWPTLSYDASDLPEFTSHLEQARSLGFPGFRADSVLCPETFNECGVALSRLVDPVLKAANYNTACPPSIPRPPGKQCDEYPFQSSYEGAYTSTTGNWNYMMIDSWENGMAGSLLGSFLGGERIIRWDTYYVEVVP